MAVVAVVSVCMSGFTSVAAALSVCVCAFMSVVAVVSVCIPKKRDGVFNSERLGIIPQLEQWLYAKHLLEEDCDELLWVWGKVIEHSLPEGVGEFYDYSPFQCIYNCACLPFSSVRNVLQPSCLRKFITFSAGTNPCLQNIHCRQCTMPVNKQTNKQTQDLTEQSAYTEELTALFRCWMYFLAGEIYQCFQVEIVYNVTMFSFHMCNDNRRNKQSWRQSSYLRKRLTIFRKVHVMGCSVSKGFLQILSRVRDELNKLKREKNNVHQV